MNPTRWRDRSPDYAGAVQEFAATAAAELSDDARTVRLRTAVFIASGAMLLAGMFCGAAGWALGEAFAEPGVITKPLPLAQSCAEAIGAAELIVAAGERAEQAGAVHDEAVDAWLTALDSGPAGDLEDAQKRLDDAKRELARVEDEHAAAVRAFRDANNRCVTEVDARG